MRRPAGPLAALQQADDLPRLSSDHLLACVSVRLFVKYLQKKLTIRPWRLPGLLGLLSQIAPEDLAARGIRYWRARYDCLPLRI